MVRPIAKILMVFWVAVVPALCMGGAIVHPCDPTAGACMDLAGRTDCPQDPSDGCGHEDSCSTDPCGSFKAVKASGGSDVEPALSIAWPHIGDAALSSMTQAERVKASTSASESPPDAHLPFPPSDLPLLI